MIYLNNNTEPQTVYVPRNDEGGYIHTGSSSSYQEGFEDGYESGMTDQRNKLTSTAFTINSAYTSIDGWSSVTVNVPTSGSTPILEDKTVIVSADTTTVTPSQGYDGFSSVTIDASEYGQSNYDNGFDDGFTDGYSSGSTDEKEKLSAVTFTANTQIVLNDGGYSAVTVNVQTYNIEANRPFTATSNGDYTITPSSTSVNDTYNNNTYTISINFNGYPQLGNSLIVLDIKDYSNLANGYIRVYYLNGMPFYYNGQWSGGSVSIQSRTSTLLTLKVNDANENYGWEKCSDYLEAYDAMSAVSLNVNVDTASTYQSGYTSGHTDGVTEGENNIIATFSSMTATTNGVYGSSAHPYSSVTVNVPQSGSSISFEKLIDRSITEVTVPSGITRIGMNAFRSCYDLTAVTMHNNVTYIGQNSFQDTGISEITIPSGVTRINDYAFCDCDSLSSVTLNNGLKSLGWGCFSWCSGLQHINIPSSVEIIEDGVFANSGLVDIELPCGVSHNCFSNCYSLTAITFLNAIDYLLDDTIVNSKNVSRLTFNQLTPPDVLNNPITTDNIAATGVVVIPSAATLSDWNDFMNYLPVGWTINQQ